MITDIWTILRKEVLEIWSGGGQRGKWGFVMIIAVFGGYMPYMTGPTWVTSPLTLVYWAWLPLFFVSSYVADSFAGERERHTLETLLASRLPDQAILLGKVFSAVALSMIITWASVLVGALTITLVYGEGQILFYSLAVTLGIFAFSLLGALMTAAVGVFVSLRAATVRQAQQTVSIGIMVIIFVPVLGIQFLPAAWLEQLWNGVAQMNLNQIIVAATAIWALLDVGLLAMAMRRFRRAQLTFD